jgi:hypothetical protein
LTIRLLLPCYLLISGFGIEEYQQLAPDPFLACARTRISTAFTKSGAVGLRVALSMTALAGDLGCLLNVAGKLHRQGWQIEGSHVAEVLAGMSDRVPPVGAPR